MDVQEERKGQECSNEYCGHQLLILTRRGSSLTDGFLYLANNACKVLDVSKGRQIVIPFLGLNIFYSEEKDWARHTT